MKKAKLTDIKDALDCQFDECTSVLNLETGEISLILNETLELIENEEDYYPDLKEEDIKIEKYYLDNPDKFIDLPSQYDVNEYSMMEDFALECEDEKKKSHLLCALKGNGAFRRFKDTVHILEIEKEWYQFRDEKYIAFILQWCEDNEIEVEI